MDQALVYKNEKTLGTITLVLAILVWIVLIVGTIGIGLIYVLMGFIFYLFAQSALISFIKGTAVELTPQQFPDLHARFVTCCNKLGMSEVPEAYILHGNGVFNAFATRFLGRNFVVLLSDIVDSMERNPDSINFYMGHELGHIRRGHLMGAVWRLPVMWLPLLAPAYRRAQEYTCDLHGRACCDNPSSAALGLTALGAGHKRWAVANVIDYAEQSRRTGGFWMSFHELTADYPWLVKRVARMANAAPENTIFPSRNPFAAFLALFVVRTGIPGVGGSVGLIAIIGILAAVAIPAYQDYTKRAQLTGVYMAAQMPAQALGRYIEANGKFPDTLQEAGISKRLTPAYELELDAEHGALAVVGNDGKLLLQAQQTGGKGPITWKCSADGFPIKHLPQKCR